MSDPMDCGCSLTSEIQCQIYNGYGQTANVIGLPYSQYRVQAPLTAPIVIDDLLGTLPASFTLAKTGFNYNKSSGPDDFAWYALIDGNKVRIGDVLVGTDGTTFYIVLMDSLLPIVAVKCNGVAAIHRPKEQTSATGPNVATLGSWTGTTIDTTSATGEDIICPPVPVAIKFVSPLSRSAGTSLPSDTHAPGAWQIFFPPVIVPRGDILNRDIIIDDIGNRYQVEDNYWSRYGYKLRARLLEI